MIIATSAFCGSCGTANLATRFCESCGALVNSAVNPLPPSTPGAGSSVVAMAGAAAATTDPATRFRILALGAIAASLVAPQLVVLWMLETNNYGDVRLLGVVLVALAAVFLVLAAVFGRATHARKWGAGSLAVSAVIVDLVVTFAWSPGSFAAAEIAGTIPLAAFFASWALGKPMSPRGYFGLAAVALVVTIRVFLETKGVYGSYSPMPIIPMIVILILVNLVSLGAVVATGILLGRSPRLIAPGAAATASSPGESPYVMEQDGLVPYHRGAVLSFVFILSSVALSLISYVIPFGGVLGVINFGLWVAALVLGHIAIVQTRRMRLRGRRLAIAALIIVYSLLLLAVIGTIVAIAVTASYLNSFGG